MRSLLLDGIAAKIQVSEGTDAVPDPATDALKCHGRVWATLTLSHAFPNLQEEVQNQSIIVPAPAPPRGWNAEIDIGWEVAGKGSAYAAEGDIAANPLLRAAGLTATVVTTGGSESITYTQAQNDFSLASVYAWAPGWLFKLIDCRCRVRWPIEPGVVNMLRFQIRGLVETTPAETVIPATFVYPSVAPLTNTGVLLTIGAYTPQKLISAEFDQGVDPQQQMDALADDGLRAFNYGIARPMFRASIPAEHAGTYDPYADHRARTSRAIALTLNNSTQYERMKLIAAAGYVGDPGHVEDNEFAAWDLEYRLPAYSLVFD